MNRRSSADRVCGFINWLTMIFQHFNENEYVNTALDFCESIESEVDKFFPVYLPKEKKTYSITTMD